MAPDAVPAVDIERVLVPLDGSELARQAIPTARALAHRFQAELHTVTVAEERNAENAREMAAAVLEVAADDHRISVLSGGEPGGLIIQRAETLGSCLVCMTSHARGRASGAFIGSVARTVLQGSDGPLVVLGPMGDNPGWSPRPRAWPEPLSAQRIVACVDGSSASEQILPIATAWADALSMSMTIVTVTNHALSPMSSRSERPRYGGHATPEEYLDQLTQQWRSPVGTDWEVLQDPISPGNALRLRQQHRPAALLALTTHARTGAQRLLLGAAAANIIEVSPAPCLVAPVR